MTRRCNRRAIGTLALGAAAVALWRTPAARARAGRVVRDVERRAHFIEGRADGWLYRKGTGGPDPDVDDDIVAERVRATLGPVVRRLDLPHVHVLVERHVALLHGDVATNDQRADIEEAVRRVAGVEGVESHLHVGLIAGDTRPSQGGQRSHDLAALVEAARRHGGGEVTSLVAVKAVLGSLAAMLPTTERARLAARLPADVRELFVPPRRTGTLRDLETLSQLVKVVAATGLVPATHAPLVLQAVLVELRRLVPEEATEVALLLPPEVRAVWDASPASTSAA